MLDEHFFRRESGRLVAALTRIYGIHNLALAEDVAQETFCRALDVWAFRGLPENPQAWLMKTAKRCALDVLRRERTARTFAPEVARLLETESALGLAPDDLLAPGALQDDLLRMMFSCCDPRLPEPTQVALILQILCGFGMGEVAAAFMWTETAAQRRLLRGKKVLATSKRLFDLAAPVDVTRRLPAVQRGLYLLFNEGYHGASPETPIRRELCHEAIRLAAVLAQDPRCSTPTTHALGALLCLHGARLLSRLSDAGGLIPLVDQDRRRWDTDLLEEGLRLLELAATGPEVSEYHLEAMIAALHAAAPSVAATDWDAIVTHYDALLQLTYSPVLALNRAVAVAQRDGPERGLEEIGGIGDADQLQTYPFYFAAVGEFERLAGRPRAASVAFARARDLARNEAERVFLEGRIAACAQVEAGDGSCNASARQRIEQCSSNVKEC